MGAAGRGGSRTIWKPAIGSLNKVDQQHVLAGGREVALRDPTSVRAGAPTQSSKIQGQRLHLQSHHLKYPPPLSPPRLGQFKPLVRPLLASPQSQKARRSHDLPPHEPPRGCDVQMARRRAFAFPETEQIAPTAKLSQSLCASSPSDFPRLPQAIC
ncbi:hypothetical protein M441DRAFT_401114 [Trichoderma asperellum CBS 433.97]|uniref:Uncharacterized protein n=1 Tax=Trichoderma asperellum (strain ATCC 204424 / CBS 433.97 / NBRC 101777) TaxID=1042311 RepID=A0A2T3Z9W3_TRIA4|nr:hypothetical protein M441DRAFT_401114 [Trichoderma asperellum CBS 433.97]PTB41576.1 hypothetical protein M441DRAFT_401114 [Trichoderma asperellum CBS 433.97]